MVQPWAGEGGSLFHYRNFTVFNIQSPMWAWVSKSSRKMRMGEIVEVLWEKLEGLVSNSQPLPLTFQLPEFNPKLPSNFRKYVFIKRGWDRFSWMNRRKKTLAWWASSTIPIMIHSSGCHEDHSSPPPEDNTKTYQELNPGPLHWQTDS